MFLLLLAGCPPRVDVRSAPPPDATALLAEVDAVEGGVAALQSQAKAHVDARGKKGNVQMFVAVAAPEDVHLWRPDPVLEARRGVRRLPAP